MKRSILLALIGTALVACASGANSGRTGLASFLSEMRRWEVDYEPLSSPGSLGQAADLVVTGNIVDVAAGQSYSDGPSHQPHVATSVIRVSVETVHRGDPGYLSDGSVYVEVIHPAFIGDGSGDGKRYPYDLEAFASTVPRARAIFFLSDRTDSRYAELIIDEGAGRPGGAKLFASYAQGFLLEVDGTLLSAREPLQNMGPMWRGLKSISDVEEAL